ncbi:MAG: glutamate racemase [Patescibacteria group bacterium]
MKIGIFDSGLGGLFVLRSIQRVLPQYDYVYLGDTKRVPYGGRSQETIYRFTKQAVEYLFRRGCIVIILACNTASARALRKLQREYLPKYYPNRRVLGVIIPTVEAALKHSSKTVGVLATESTVESGAYIREIKKRNRKVDVIQKAAPLLVPLVENAGLKFVEPVLNEYLRGLKRLRPQTVVLGCTHYGILQSKIKRQFPSTTRIITQNQIVPGKLQAYLKRHREISGKLAHQHRLTIFVTDITPHVRRLAWKWFGKHIPLKIATLPD